jgi:hypothetical protein
MRGLLVILFLFIGFIAVLGWVSVAALNRRAIGKRREAEAEQDAATAERLKAERHPHYEPTAGDTRRRTGYGSEDLAGERGTVVRSLGGQVTHKSRQRLTLREAAHYLRVDVATVEDLVS